jgi:hypothetical protein
VPERLDVSIQLPYLNVIGINELLGESDGFDIIIASQLSKSSQNRSALTLWMGQP